MFTNDLLKNKRIYSRTGRAMAERFLQLGATVYICGRKLEVVQKQPRNFRFDRRARRRLRLRRALPRTSRR